MTDVLTEEPELGVPAREPGSIPLGRTALDFVGRGAPRGHQRETAVKVARNYWGAGYELDECADALWLGLQASENDPAQPWTYEDAFAIARDIYHSPAPPVKPLGPPVSIIWDDDATPQYPPSVHTFARTDTGNAELIAHIFGDDLRYDVLRQDWLVWSRHFWRYSDGEVARQHAKRAARWRFDAAALLLGDARESEIKWALHSEKRKGIDDALALARGTPPVYDDGRNWNTNPMLLAVENGVLDLQTGELREGMRSDRITFHAPVIFDADATCPRFTRFLERVQPDPELRRWLQRFAGHCLTGDVSEEVLVFNYGGGSNGKSTFWTCLQDLLGLDLAKQAAKGLLVAHKFERHSTEIAELCGSRLVVSTEVDDGTVLAEGLVKWLTGGDRINARLMHRDNFQFNPTFKLVLLANKRPLVTDDTVSTWRRIKVVPWTVTITEDERDNSLKSALKDELSGILNWVLAGCLEWQAIGLGENDDVVRATAAYRDSAVAGFIEDCCIERPDVEIPAGAFFNLYKTWCLNNGSEATLNGNQFGELMARRYAKKRSGRGVYYHGVVARASLIVDVDDR